MRCTPLLVRCIAPLPLLGALHPPLRLVHCTSPLLFGALHLPSSLGALHRRLLCDALRQLLCLLLGIRSNGCPPLVVFFPPSTLC